MAKLTNLQQAEFAQKAVADGWKYWYGTCAYLATQSLLNSKARQYPSHYTDKRMPTYQKHIAEGRMVADCVGLQKGFFWTENGTRKAGYGINNCPDKSANGFFKLCSETGDIGAIPSTPGLVVWTDGHIGISLDGVYAVEARGFNDGVIRTKIRDRTWKKWGRLPPSMLDYVEGSATLTPPAEPVPETGCAYAEPTQNIRKGAKGDGVRWVQWMLEACGFSVGSSGIDGDFGSRTHAAVLEAQRQQGLKADGIVGPLTRAALKNALAGNAEKPDTPEPLPPVPVEKPTYQPRGKIADLSKWQGPIDWTAAARELDFCILRAQYGHEKQDERYLEYVRGCERMGIPYGAYSYCLFDDEETAREEARFFVERIQGTKPGFLVLDLEPGGVRARDICKEVSAYIAQLRALGIKRIGLYIAHQAYQTYNIDVSEADFVWIPRYGSNSGMPETQPDYPCDLWQYTSNGTVAGMRGRVTLNKLMDETRLSWFREREA